MIEAMAVVLGRALPSAHESGEFVHLTDCCDHEKRIVSQLIHSRPKYLTG